MYKDVIIFDEVILMLDLEGVVEVIFLIIKFN